MKATCLCCLLSLAAGAAQGEALDPAELGRTTFAEDFDVLRLRPADPRGWTPRFWWVDQFDPGGVGFPSPNQELQWYVNPAHAAAADLNPFKIDGGVLRIVATAVPAPLRPLVRGAPYASGFISTFRSFSQRYGYFEVRARMPAGRGLWPAIWLLPDSGEKAEIDIVEVLGQEPRRAHHAVHSWASGAHQTCEGSTETADLAGNFHTFGVAWRSDRIRFYVDRQLVFTCPTPADMHTPHYLILNLAVGGWAGQPDAVAFPVEMLIDWVRVYEVGP